VAAAGTAEETLFRAAYGQAQLTPRTRPMPEDALFDLASLTKIVVTAPLLLRYVEQGRLFLDQPVAGVLPAFGALGKAQVTLRHLLTHTSGLPAWRDLRALAPARGPTGSPPTAPPTPAALGRILDTALERPPGKAVVYSDLGYIALGAVLAEVGGAPLDVLARREVLGPLGMRGARYRPGPAGRARAVATEVVPERGGALVGEVHDENAAALGGVSGHAGLFATCADLERFCRLWLGQGHLEGRRFLSPATVRAATRDHTGGEARRGLGWVLQPNPLWVPADLCSPAAYSHTGFTGTSLLLDPEPGIFAVLLTNRVHPTREGGSAAAVRAVRARFHNAVWAALCS
jgi:CubicO group peptidase (beta-lactamase class C family)